MTSVGRSSFVFASGSLTAVSFFATNTAVVRSAVTFTIVRHMSRMRSTPEDERDRPGGHAHLHQDQPDQRQRPARARPAMPVAVRMHSTSTTSCCPSVERARRTPAPGTAP